MSHKISKELFEAVTGISVSFEMFEVNKNVIKYHLDTDEFQLSRKTMLANDFFFMCKEWATKKCIWISSWNSNDTNHKSGLCEVGHCVKGKIGIFESHTEQQAVFDACQWILDNRDKQ